MAERFSVPLQEDGLPSIASLSGAQVDLANAATAGRPDGPRS